MSGEGMEGAGGEELIRPAPRREMRVFSLLLLRFLSRKWNHSARINRNSSLRFGRDQPIQKTYEQ